jgi:hypothetical protein
MLLVKFRKNLHALNKRQKRTIIQQVVLLNIIMFSMLLFVTLRINTMLYEQNSYFNDRLHPDTETHASSILLDNKIPIDTKISLVSMKDINLKDKTIGAQVLLGLSYNQPDFKDGTPKISLYNGKITDQRLMTSSIKDGRVNEQFVIDVAIEPNYQSQLYPLDKELITMFFTPFRYNANYYFYVSEFIDDTDYANLGQGDYKLINMGFRNFIESIPMVDENNQHITNFYAINRTYALFNHKNLYSYIKSIQYILLSLLIAIFALLINAKINSPKNGRITVIGSSVFSLAANVFQINSINRVVSQITLIDLITSFAALVIFLAFLVSLRTLTFLDEDGYETSKIFDMSMFFTLLSHTIIFFVFIYLYI